MTGLDALELLFVAGQALVLLSLVYFLYLVIGFRARHQVVALERTEPAAKPEPAPNHGEHPHHQEIAPA